ncbi:hypothetical protein CsSME_00028612 [Camellia sinensis var. sinensis]
MKEALRAGIGKIKRLSLSETTLEKATKSYGIDLVRFTQKNIMRVYPMLIICFRTATLNFSLISFSQ